MKDTSDYAVRARRRHRDPPIEIPMPDWPATVANDDPRLTDLTWVYANGPGNLHKWTQEERWALEMRSYLTTRVGRYWKGIDCTGTVGPPLAPGIKWYCIGPGDRHLTDGWFAGRFLTVPTVAWAIGVHRMKLSRFLMLRPSWVKVYIRHVAPAKDKETRYPWLDGMKMIDLAADLAAHGIKTELKQVDAEDLYQIARAVGLNRLKAGNAWKANGSNRASRKRT